MKDATELLTENKKKVFSAVALVPSVSARPGKVPKEWLRHGQSTAGAAGSRPPFPPGRLCQEEAIPAPGGDNQASHLAQQVPTGTTMPWERRQDTLQSLFPRTTAAFTRFHSTAREDSKPPLPCHHCQLTWLLCASVSLLVKIPLAKPPLSCLILGATKTMVRLASLTATPVPGREGDAPACPTPSHPPSGRLH